MEWWKFNGYGFYIWGTYGVALMAVALETLLLATRRRRALRRLEDAEEIADIELAGDVRGDSR